MDFSSVYERPKALKSKFQIGSVHGRLNYNPESQAFHKSDIPEKVKGVSYKIVSKTQRRDHRLQESKYIRF